MPDYSFNQAIKAVLPHVASEREMLPTLSVVQVFADRVVASDRYTLARSYFEPHIEGEFDEPFFLHVTDAKELAKGKMPIESLNADGGQLTIRYESDAPARVPKCYPDGIVPPLERLFPKDTHGQVGGPVLVRPKFLPRLDQKHLARGLRERQLNVVMSQEKRDGSVYWTFSDHTDGLLMPSKAR